MEYETIDIWGTPTECIVLGEDHWLLWLVSVPSEGERTYETTARVPEGRTPFGAYDIHYEEGRITVGHVSWAEPGIMKLSGHQLVSVDPPELSPSLACRSCPSHGFVRAGKWVNA